MSILVTGGTGYIGSHTCVELLNAGYDTIVVDNLSNSEIGVVDKISQITGKSFKFYQEDVLNEEGLCKVFEENKIDAVIHFAALKAVGESVEKPLEYYSNNITGLLTLCRVMRKYGCKSFVFSSSATVYGNPASLPITEEFPLSATNPYGQTKLMSETILRDLFASDNSWKVSLLRYFNPIGAHESGLLGEMPNGIPNNLMPYITQVAAGKLEFLHVFGNDYHTHDGTGVRDYIHVVDLAKGHLSALAKLEQSTGGVFIHNLGTGTGYSVLDVVHAFESATGVQIPYQICPRRPGDIDACYADPSKAYRELGWKAAHSLEDMCRSSWQFVKKYYGK